MNLLTAENIEKSFTERKLLNGASFYLEEGEKLVSSVSTEPESPRC